MPQRRLLLLRHAKSSWASPDLADHDRPLAPRGLKAVETLRRHAADVHLAPALVLCSTARRAVETWEGLASGCPPGTPVEFTEQLYGATAGDLMRRVRRLPDTVGSVLLVGHNPGLEDLAQGLIGSGDAELRQRLDVKFPTGALATLLCPGWRDLGWGTAELIGYVTPRQLRDSE